MNLGKLNSLHYALIAFAIIAVILGGISYYRQQQAETRLTALVNSVRTATSLEELQSSVEVFATYTGAGRSASAAKCQGGVLVGERGKDKDLPIGTCEDDWSGTTYREIKHYDMSWGQRNLGGAADWFLSLF